MKNNDDDYRLKINLLCVVKNVSVLGLFTILSIAFNRWWIIFFSTLFWSSVKIEKVIIVKSVVGKGTKEDLCREITEIYDLKGRLIARIDPCKE